MFDWKASLSSLEREYQQQDQRQDGQDMGRQHFKRQLPKKEKAARQVSSKEPRGKSFLSKNDIKVLLIANNLIRSIHQEAEQQTRATTFTIVPQDKLLVRPSTTLAYILCVLSPSPTALHITALIERMQELGFTSESKYHLYSNVGGELRRHSYMFARAGKGTYALREAFRGDAPVPVRIASSHCNALSHITPTLPALTDIVQHIAKEYPTAKGTTSPTRVWNILQVMGIQCARSTVQKVMKNDTPATAITSGS